MNAAVVGVSPDSPESHGDFVGRHSLEVMLLSDQGHDVLDDYDVCRSEKGNGLGRHEVRRTTFLIDPEGMVRHVWRNVSVFNHSAEVGERLMELEGLI